MAYQAGGQRPAPRPVPDSPEAQAYLQDCGALMAALPFPSLVVDHRWDVVLANTAYQTLFRPVGPHPTAMPGDNFLRFVLFHPDAGAILGDHETSWCLPMLALFRTALERHAHDPVLQGIRQEIAQDPIMEAAFRQGLPHWMRAVGEEAVRHDGAVRPLLHPDPRRGATECRLLDETTPMLRDMGWTRLTLLLREPRRTTPPPRGRRRARSTAHLTVVPTPGS